MITARWACRCMADPVPPPNRSADRLQLAQLLSPTFPIGSFAPSQGPETATAGGLVPDPTALQDWIIPLLPQGSARQDAVFVSLIRQNSLPLPDLTAIFHAMTALAEPAQKAAEPGQGFGTLLAAPGRPQPPLPYPPAHGLATRPVGPADGRGSGAVLAVIQLLSVGVRFMPMGQAQGQILLAALTPLIAPHGPLRVGIGGPVGAGKPALTKHLCRAPARRCSMAVITDDIFTREDADHLLRAQVLAADRIRGVETGGCPHTAIRGDASVNPAATFSPGLADLTICGIDTAAGQDIPRKKGPRLTRSDLLVIHKTGLARHVGVDLGLSETVTRAACAPRRYIMAQLRHAKGITEVVDFLTQNGGLTLRP